MRAALLAGLLIPWAVLGLACAEPSAARAEPSSAAAEISPENSADEPTAEEDSERLPDLELARGRTVVLGRFGDARHMERRVRVWLPPEHDPRRPSPVLYVFDGGEAETMAIPATLERLLAEGAIEPWIAVFIDSTSERTEELALDAESMAPFLLERIEPALAAEHALREGPEARALLGFSYGGLAALRAGLRRPDRFGRLIAMSPSLWWRQRALLSTLARQRSRLPRRLWLDVGSLEGHHGDLVPYMVHDARRLRDAMRARGLVFGRELGYLEAIDEDHGMEAAGRRMRAALAFGLSDRDLSEARPEVLRLSLYPSSRRERYRTFAVEARYEGGARLTWPPALLETELGGRARDLSGSLLEARARGPLLARLRGVSVSRGAGGAPLDP